MKLLCFQDIAVNVFSIHKEIQSLRSEIKYLALQMGDVLALHEKFEKQLNSFQNQITEAFQSLQNKCGKSECQKISKKVRRLRKTFEKMFTNTTHELQKLNESKCSLSDCQNLKTNISQISLEVEALNQSDETLVQHFQNLSTLSEMVLKINDSYCSKEMCQSVMDDVITMKGDITNINTNISRIQETKCSQASCQDLASDLTNFGKISDALYSSQEDLLARYNDLDSEMQGKCDKQQCDQNVQQIQLLGEDKCSRDFCENSAIGLTNIETVVGELFSEVTSIRDNACSQETCGIMKSSLSTIDGCLISPGSSDCTMVYYQDGSLPSLVSLHQLCFNNPGNYKRIKRYFMINS